MSDHKVKDYMANISKQEHKLQAISEAKLKLDKDVGGLDAEPTRYVLIKRRLHVQKINFQNKGKDLHEADESRSLYSLHKPVKEVTVYPDDFSGDVCENLFKCKEKFLNALEANHV